MRNEGRGVVVKRIIAAMLLIVMAIFCACDTKIEDDGKITIMATNFPGYDFARQIVGNSADIKVEQLLPPGTESHGYEPSPKEIIAMENCDLFIYVGGESDAWVEKILESMDNPPKTVKIMELSELVHSDHHHEGNEVYDEHVWTSPANAISITKGICEEICSLDKANAEKYRENSGEYCKKIEELQEEFTAFFTKNDKTLVFGDRFPFIYFAKEFGVEYISAFPGCGGETEADAGTIAEIIDMVNNDNIKTIFHIEFSNANVARAIAQETGTQAKLFHSCHNVSKQEIDDGATYVSLMRQNLETLKEGI